MKVCPACKESVADSRFCPACGAPLREPDPSATGPYAVPPRPVPGGAFAPGRVLADRYRIVALLGKGGMGEVYRADDLTLGQPVALKFLPARLTDDLDRLTRFRKEVATARRVSHPNVCRVYDIAEADGRIFLTMEFIDGEDLASLLRRVGRLPEEKAVEVSRQLCSALAAVHEQGLLHRDLKPANVMLDGRGKVRLTDFGLAAIAGEVADVRSGTAAYQAPEQFAGREVSVQSDLFALGLVLYEVFTGKPAFSGSSREELAHRLMEPPSKPSGHVSGMNAAAERVILRCLEREPKDRPRSAVEVLAALPGGDPLAAALAAGETPSPKMIADAGGNVGLSPRTGLLCLLGVIVGVILTAILAPHERLFQQLAADRHPVALAARAQELLAAIGHDEAPRDRAYGFAMDEGAVRFLSRQEPASRMRGLAEGQPAAVCFWYRQSPDWLVPTRVVDSPAKRMVRWQEVRLDDPPETVAGMVTVRFDLRGNLIELRARPPREIAPDAVERKPDWKLLFKSAGLRYEDFEPHPTDPVWNPPVYADGSWAWQRRGVLAAWPDAEVRVEAASCRGRPVYFRVVGPWSDAEAPRSLRDVQGGGIYLTASIAFLVLLLLASVVLSARNLLLGLVDRRGATRLLVFLLATGMLVWLLRASHVPTEAEYYLFLLGQFTNLYMSATVTLYYVALEPYVRRFWPQTLISWNRVLDGRFTDPLVGRDLLVGALAGVASVLLVQGAALCTAWLGLPAPPLGSGGVRDTYHVLLGPAPAASLVLEIVGGAIRTAILTLLFMLVARGLLRSAWLAAGVYIAWWVTGNLFVFGHPAVAWFFLAVQAGLVILLLVRCGLLAVVAYNVVNLLLVQFPITSDLSVWYAGTGLFAMGLVVVLAVYGFLTATGGVRNLLAGPVFSVNAGQQGANL